MAIGFTDIASGWVSGIPELGVFKGCAKLIGLIERKWGGSVVT